MHKKIHNYKQISHQVLWHWGRTVLSARFQTIKKYTPKVLLVCLIVFALKLYGNMVTLDVPLRMHYLYMAVSGQNIRLKFEICQGNTRTSKDNCCETSSIVFDETPGSVVIPSTEFGSCQSFKIDTVREVHDKTTRPALEKVPPDFIFDVLLGRFEKKQGLMR